MISHHLKWFLGLSVAVHVAVLVALAPDENKLGVAGRSLSVSVNDRSGKAALRPSTASADEMQAVSEDSALQPQATQAVTTDSAAPKHHPAERSVALLQPETIIETGASQSPAIQATSTGLSRDEQRRHLRASVMEFITGQLNYPAIARRKGWQGIVTLELLIESDGHISDLHIEESSGYALLDKAALDSLQLAHVPDAAHWLDGKAVSIIVPVEYRLVDG